jgi:hypothetical protein
MTKRFIIIMTIFSFLNLLCGCTKTTRLTVEEARAKPKGKIQALGLHGSYPYNIELEDIATIQFIGINRATAGGSIRDTVDADRFESEMKKYEATKIIAVTLKSGEETGLEDRDVFYDTYADVVKVGGSEILFDSTGGRFDTSEEMIYGRTMDGDSVGIKTGEVAYLRRVEINYGATILLIAGITTVAAVGIILIIGSTFELNLD